MLYSTDYTNKLFMILIYSLMTFNLINLLMFFSNKKYFFKNMNMNYQIIKYMNY